MPLVTGNESGTKWGRLRRLSEVLRSQGMQASQPVTFLTDQNLISRIKRGHAARAGGTRHRQLQPRRSPAGSPASGGSRTGPASGAGRVLTLT